MAIKKIPCGGFFYDDESIEFDGDVMKVVGGGASLPEVATEDNGDVLTVVEGAWAKAAPSGGVTVVHFEVDEDEEVVTADMTVAEVGEAVTKGLVIGSYLYDGETMVTLECHIILGAGNPTIFGTFKATDGTFNPLFYGDNSGWHIWE